MPRVVFGGDVFRARLCRLFGLSVFGGSVYRARPCRLFVLGVFCGTRYILKDSPSNCLQTATVASNACHLCTLLYNYTGASTRTVRPSFSTVNVSRVLCADQYSYCETLHACTCTFHILCYVGASVATTFVRPPCCVCTLQPWLCLCVRAIDVCGCLVLQDYSPDLHTISRKQTTKSSANDGGVTITKIQRNSSHHDNFTPRNDTTTSSQPPPR